jgi:predicted nucleic-acid-binding Zn-ribbon protein
MGVVEKKGCIVEYNVVSDKDSKPTACIKCGCTDLTCRTHQFIDRQDLGTPTIKRIQRHEWVYWECKNCRNTFSIRNPAVEYDCSFTNDVKLYVFKRVLEKGDSSTRVVSDLQDLHNIDVDVTTILDWIQDKKEQDAKNTSPQSGGKDLVKDAKIICLDGTFTAVTPKKNDQANEKDEPFCLQLTRLKDGRLAAFWQSGSEKKKPSRS